MSDDQRISRRKLLATGSTYLFAGWATTNTPALHAKGSALQEVKVAGYSGRAIAVAAGSTIRVTNIFGRQVGDMFALLQSDPSEHLDTARTRLITGQLFPSVGQQFVSNFYRPLLTFKKDTSPGIHDTLSATCDPGFYDERNHPNCHDNFLSATQKIGLKTETVPMPVNLFQDTPFGSDGKIEANPSPAQAGDYVEFLAEEDLYFVLTSCSVDIDGRHGINGGKSKALHIQVR